MHFANALVWEIIGPAMAGPTGPCATPMHLKLQKLQKGDYLQHIA